MPLRIKIFLANLTLLILPSIMIYFFASSILSTHPRYSKLIIIGSIAAAFIVLATNVLIAYSIGAGIAMPLKSLKDAAKEIKNGNLDFELDFQVNEDFREVMTEFNEMRLKLRESLEQNIEYENERKYLMASITHDLKTPLATVQGYIEGILDNVANSPEKKKKYLETISKKTKIMNSLVDDLFLLSKHDLQKATLNIETVSIAEYICSFLDDIEHDMCAYGSIERNITTDAPINIDIIETARVLRNIFDNSIKYRRTDTALIIKVDVKLSEKVIIAISDNGIGIDKENEAKLFLPFFREDPSRKHGEGSGLGLSIAKKIISSQGGQIWARSIKDGTTVYISFPVATIAD